MQGRIVGQLHQGLVNQAQCRGVISVLEGVSCLVELRDCLIRDRLRRLRGGRVDRLRVIVDDRLLDDRARLLDDDRARRNIVGVGIG